MEEFRWFRNGHHVKVPLLEHMAKDKFRPIPELNLAPLLHFHGELTRHEQGLEIVNLGLED